MVSWIAHHLSSLTGYANTTITPIGVEEEVGNHEVVG